MAKPYLEEQLARTIRAESLLADDEPVLLAVSGGPDSVAMLYALAALNAGAESPRKLHVGHLNHQLRGVDADADAGFVEDLCRQLRVPCTVEAEDVAARAKADSISVEQAGRSCRFAFFERLCFKTGIRKVALAHHADDNAETVLHRIVRGTGLRGLSGIRVKRPLRPGSELRVIRPLLEVRRADIEAYLADQGLAYREDISNLSPGYTRNRIRHELLPLLREKFNPQVSEALIRLAGQARGVNAYLAETGERMLDSLVIEHDDRQLTLHCPPLLRKPRVIQTQLIRKAILRMGFPEGELSYAHLNAVADLAAGKEGTKSLDLPAGLRISRRYSRLVLERAGQRITGSAAHEVRVATEGQTLLPEHGFTIDAQLISADTETINAHLGRHASREQACYEEWLDADAVHPPLIARSRRPGDRFFPLGLGGMKKLSDFLIDEKVEAAQRERVVVLCDQLGPIWIVPWRIDERVRLTGATRRILQVRVQPTVP